MSSKSNWVWASIILKASSLVNLGKISISSVCVSVLEKYKVMIIRSSTGSFITFENFVINWSYFLKAWHFTYLNCSISPNFGIALVFLIMESLSVTVPYNRKNSAINTVINTPLWMFTKDFQKKKPISLKIAFSKYSLCL